MSDRRRYRAAAALAAVLITLFSTASAASATTYCVASAPNCSGTAEPDFATALTKAGSDTVGSDTIVLPATTMSASGGFEYFGTVPLEVDGQGSSSTILTVPDNASETVFDIPGGDHATVTIKSLGIDIPAASSEDGGIWSSPNTIVDNVVVSASSPVNDGIDLPSGGEISDTTVSVPTTATGINTAVWLNGSATVQDSSFAGVEGLVDSSGATLSVHRITAVGATTGGAALEINSEGSAEIDDSLLVAQTGAYGLFDDDSIAGVTARQLTIVGDSQSIGIEDDDSTTQGTPMTVSDSIIAGPFANAFVIYNSGIGEGTITLDHSDYDHTDLPSGITSGAGNLPSYVAPAFADPGSGDHRLLASSPAALFGADPTTARAGESSTDLGGLPRFNGTARDLGAYQHQAPTVTAAATAATVVSGAVASFTATGNTTEPNDPLTYKWSFDDGQSATGASVSHAFSAAGAHTATVTVTDALGFTATSTAALTVTKAPSATKPSNAFTVKASRVKKTDTLALKLATKSPGTARITSTYTETIKHKRRTLTYTRTVTIKVGAKHTASLKLEPTSAARKHLRSVKREKISVTVSFTPTGGTAAKHKLTVSV